MKKRFLVSYIVLSLIFSSILVSAMVSAADTETQKVAASYKYLTNAVAGTWGSQDSENNALALLALAYDDALAFDGKESLMSKSLHGSCWPSSSCKIKSTALAMLALNRMGEDTDNVTAWIMSKQKAFQTSGISWYLQLDSSAQTNCTVRYETSRTVQDKLILNKDKTYALPSASSCLELSGDRYWMRIKSTCLDKSYYITCDDSAVASLLYKLGETLYLQAETLTVPAEVSISTICLADTNICSYEGTLWAAYSLMRAGKDYGQLLPYLISEADNNQKILPDGLLWLLTSKEEHASKLLVQQLKDGSWNDVGGYGKFWDTGLASLALKDYSPDNVSKAKDFLLKNQEADGSWGTYKIRDTALILYSLWPKDVTSVSSNDCVDVQGFVCRDSCETGEINVDYPCLAGICCQTEGFSGNCKSIEDCLKPECDGLSVTDFFGKKGVCEYGTEKSCKDEFDNDYNGLTDMADTPCQQTCYQLLGTECAVDESCDGEVRETVETKNCCTGTCVKEDRTCSEQGGVFCKNSQTCTGNPVAAKDATTETCCQGTCKGSSILMWVIILIVLIALGAGGYYGYKKGYFDRFKKKPGFQGGTPTSRGPIGFQPPVRPFSSSQTPPPQFMQRPNPSRPANPELDDTMSKLKRYSEKK